MLRLLAGLFGLRGAAVVPWRWRLFHPTLNRRWGTDAPAGGKSADWHEGLDDVFEVMDANLAVRRGQLDNARGQSAAASPLDLFDSEAPLRPSEQRLRAGFAAAAPRTPPPAVERRKSPPPPVVSRDNVGSAALGVTRASDQLSPEALDAIATRVAEKLKASMAVPPPPSVPERRTANQSSSVQRRRRPPLITIRIRRPFFGR